MSTATFPEADTQRKLRHQPLYNVVLLDDDYHTFDYVVRMLKQLFGHPEQKGALFAKEVHERGRAIIKTCALELAELKRDQIHAFGPDPAVARCKGSMSCELEPAE